MWDHRAGFWTVSYQTCTKLIFRVASLIEREREATTVTCLIGSHDLFFIVSLHESQSQDGSKTIIYYAFFLYNQRAMLTISNSPPLAILIFLIQGTVHLKQKRILTMSKSNEIHTHFSLTILLPLHFLQAYRMIIHRIFYYQQISFLTSHMHEFSSKLGNVFVIHSKN